MGLRARFARHKEKLAKETPGKRFQERFRQKERLGHSRGKRAVKLVFGGLLLAAGLVLMPAPGPGILVVILGAGILAESSLFVAKLLDALELRARDLARKAARLWSRTPPVARIGAVALVVLIASSAAFAAVRLVF